jgi:hypothetical protein
MPLCLVLIHTDVDNDDGGGVDEHHVKEAFFGSVPLG